MSAALGAQGPANADLAGALRDRGQHDVHDADAAHEQRDRGDHGQQHFVPILGALGLLQAVERHGQFRVRLWCLSRMVLICQAGWPDFVGVRHDQRDLAVIHLLAAAGAGWRRKTVLPKRPSAVPIGMYTSLLKSSAAMLPPLPAVGMRSAATPTTT